MANVNYSRVVICRNISARIFLLETNVKESVINPALDAEVCGATEIF